MCLWVPEPCSPKSIGRFWSLGDARGSHQTHAAHLRVGRKCLQASPGAQIHPFNQILSDREKVLKGHRTTPTPAAQGHSSKGNVSKCHAPPTALVRALEPKFSRTSLHLRTDGGMSKPRGTRRPQGVLLATRMWERVDETQRQGKLSSFQDDATASRVQRKRRGGSA